MWRLAKEVRKTQRRVNALEKMVIPGIQGDQGLHRSLARGEGARGGVLHQAAQGEEGEGGGPMKGLMSRAVVLAEGLYSSAAPVKYAVAMAKVFGTEVTAVYAVDTAAIRHLSRSRIFVDEESEEYERSLEETGRRRLAFVEELAKAKGVSVATRLLKGSIAGEVAARSRGGRRPTASSSGGGSTTAIFGI